MFLLPVGHEEDELRRWPWVSLTLGALCVLVFLGMQLFEARAERRAREAAAAALAWAADKPWLVVDEDLLFAEVASPSAEAWPVEEWSDDGAEPGAVRIGEQQAELDRLTARWRSALAVVPERALGLVPAELSAPRLVTHLFAHADLLHLAANLFFLWLLAPPLEDVWGRPLFAAFFLAAGVVAGLLWVGRYPNSEVPVIGASGAIAGLMGAFMIRFWRSKIRFVYFLWAGLRIFPGSFTAPAWLMLGLWFLRELALSTLFEPHATPGGGVAIWGHIYGFAYGTVAALAIRGIGVERRWVRPAILAATGELENPVLERAHELRQAGRTQEAWRALAREVEARPGNLDAVIAWWDLACASGREREVAASLVEAIRAELRSGQTDVAWQHWQELRDKLPDFETPPDLKVSLAESLLGSLGSRSEIGGLLASARAQLGPSPPPGLAVKLARTSARAGLPGAAALCARLAADPTLPESVQRELDELARNVQTEPPAGRAALERGENR